MVVLLKVAVEYDGGFVRRAVMEFYAFREREVSEQQQWWWDPKTTVKRCKKSTNGL